MPKRKIPKPSKLLLVDFIQDAIDYIFMEQFAASEESIS